MVDLGVRVPVTKGLEEEKRDGPAVAKRGGEDGEWWSWV